MQRIERLRANVQKCFFGNRGAIDQVITCLLARGHVLLEDVPGVGKTTLSVALAKSLDMTLNRLQMTPDMLPSDILGVTVWDPEQREFIFKPGPIFANIVLADEINRTTPRTQSALLEAMSESQVSMDGVTRRLLSPFLVLATQNPFEFEGTYFLPESQLDRFLMRLNLGYPSPEDEARVLMLNPRRSALADLEPVMTAEELVKLQDTVEAIRVEPPIAEYVVALADATRTSDQLHLGVSTRGALALLRAAKATAFMGGRDYVIPDDVSTNVLAVFAHRCVGRAYMHESTGDGIRLVLQQILGTVPAPV